MRLLSTIGELTSGFEKFVPDRLPEIAGRLFVLTKLPGFSVFLRRHREYLDDFVMYAIPPERRQPL